MIFILNDTIKTSPHNSNALCARSQTGKQLIRLRGEGGGGGGGWTRWIKRIHCMHSSEQTSRRCLLLPLHDKCATVNCIIIFLKDFFPLLDCLAIVTIRHFDEHGRLPLFVDLWEFNKIACVRR